MFFNLKMSNFAHKNSNCAIPNIRMVSKTREKLIDVARQLFAHKGVENTTMNDIAAASDKGRRTIYTYFKNKREIYNAVIEKESEQIVYKLRSVADSNETPENKLRQFMYRRFETMAELTSRHDSTSSTIRSFFSRDFRRLDKIRKTVFNKEREIFKEILAEGIEEGIFDKNQSECLPALENFVFQGADYFVMNMNSEDEKTQFAESKKQIIDFIVNGIKLPSKR